MENAQKALFPQYSASEEQRQATRNFQSLRRYFITEREKAICNPVVLPALVGHQRQGMTFGLYSAGPSLEQLRECVEAVRLEGLAADEPAAPLVNEVKEACIQTLQ